jgi:hypothetical protein
MVLRRPDKVRVTRNGGFANVEMVFDGKTLLGQNAYLSLQVEAPERLDHLVDALRDKFRRPVPDADLLLSMVQCMADHCSDAYSSGGHDLL